MALLRADWIWDGEHAPFAGELELRRGRIAKVLHGAFAQTPTGRSFRLLLPGFVNAHAHLDLSLERHTDTLAGSFGDWLLSVRDRRLAEGADGLERAARAGLERALAGGTTTIVDYDATRRSAAAFAGSPMRRVLLREIIAFDAVAGAGASARASWEEYLAESPDPEREVRGLAPHAPYTVHRDVLGASVSIAAAARAPWSMHVAEQRFEEEFLRTGAGEFAAFLARAGVATAGFPLPRCSPIEYLCEMGWLAARPLLVHANYLSESDIDLLAEAQPAVVYCPRSHGWFGHGAHPLPRLLDAGVEVALGTDGMITSGDLSMLEELRAVRRAFPRLAPAAILRMATVAGHAALGGRLGSGRLSEGEPADAVIVEVRPAEGRRAGDPLEALLDPASGLRVLEVWIGGERAHAVESSGTG